MEKSIKIIKLKKDEKVVIVTRPNTFKDLEMLFKEKFKVSDLNHKTLVFNDGTDDISIESDQDLLNAYEYVETGLKIHLKSKKNESTQASHIGMSHLAMYSDFLESQLPKFVQDVGEIIERDEIPCKECFFDKQNDDSSFDLDEDYCCAVCNDKGSVAMTKSWKIILLLIDFKIKQYLLKPIRSFQGLEDTEKTVKKDKQTLNPKTFARKNTGVSSKEDSRMSEMCHSFTSRTNCKITPLFRNHVRSQGKEPFI